MSDAVVVPGDPPAVRLERHLAEPPEVVWRALTDRRELTSWFPCDVVVEGGEWRVGARLTFPFPADVIDMTLTGEVLAVEAPRLLSYTWGDDTLRFELEPDGGGTRLVLEDRLPAPWAARNAAGWEECLERLCGVKESGGEWQPRFERYAAAFEPLLGVQEGPPADMKQ